MNDNQIITYCDDIKETALKQFYKIQNQQKEISLLHKKCASQQAEIERLENHNKEVTENCLIVMNRAEEHYNTLFEEAKEILILVKEMVGEQG